MNLKYDYWFFKKVLSDNFINKVIETGKKRSNKLAITGKELRILKKSSSENLSKKEIKNLKKVRNSKIVFMNDPWLYNEITPFVQIANQSAGWNFNVDWNESFQFTSYKKGGHYDWHQDSWIEAYQNKDPNFNNKIRKLSVIISLSDPKDYEGGELLFSFHNPNSKTKKHHKVEQIRQKGSVVVFPSHLWHKVTPVTKGKRYSLVMWVLGPEWK
jgi:PKHD-type hydroxylase